MVLPIRKRITGIFPGDEKKRGEPTFQVIEEHYSTRMLKFIDKTVQDGVYYQYRIDAVKGTQKTSSLVSDPVTSVAGWFKWGKLNVLIATVILVCSIIYFISLVRKGEDLYVRRIPGIDAIEEAVGRATEMGKGVLFIPGTSTIEDVATLAALNILGEVTRKIVHYNAKLICPNYHPIVYTVAREIVHEAYKSEGRPDAYDPASVFFLVQNQFAYTAAVDGIMVREKPAANFFMGYYHGESLLLAEVGAQTGAIQVAGTDAVSQLPFFVTACDYTLIGEELYAASAYLGAGPLLLGTLKAQDMIKLIILVIVLLGSMFSLVLKWNVVSWIESSAL